MKVQDIRIRFVFIKATEGTDLRDDYFNDNWEKCRLEGITRGAYHYFLPDGNGLQQANNFIAAATLQRGDMPPVIDVEDAGGQTPKQLQAALQVCITTLEKHYKVKPIIYTNPGFYTNFLKGFLEDYPLWVAHYGQDAAPGITRSWTFWQHNCEGHINGIASDVDFNVFNGDSTAFLKLLLQ